MRGQSVPGLDRPAIQRQRGVGIIASHLTGQAEHRRGGPLSMAGVDGLLVHGACRGPVPLSEVHLRELDHRFHREVRVRGVDHLPEDR
jgi:hypothetical protein